MREKKILADLKIVFALCVLNGLIYAGNIAREFNIFAPPQCSDANRTSFVVVTAVVGNDLVTEVDIVDRAEDGDSDDTHENLSLTQGQSYIVYLKEGTVNDDFAGIKDGDYFRINGSRRIQTMIGTTSDWEYDYVPPYWHTNGTVDFFVYVPYGSAADEWRLNVISYEDGTSVYVEDITNTPTTGSGYTSVKEIGSGSNKWSGILNKGQDLLKVKNVNALGNTPGGRTFHVHATDSVAVMVGSLKQNDSGRDDGCYVKAANGLNVATEFYFYQPDGANNEKEVKVNTYSQPATINLYCWNNNQWNQIVTNEALDAYDYFTYTGNSSIGYTQELFKLTATEKVAVCTGTWLETGSIGTSDMACYVSSEYGYGAGHNYIAFLAPPGTEPDGDYTHLYITTIDSNTTVTIDDIATDGTIIDRDIVLNTNDFYDLKIDVTTWNQLTSGDNEPYLKIYSAKEIRVFNSNWNDNWLAFAAGTVVPQYSPAYYENFPYQRWVFMGMPIQPVSSNPDSIFGPYFGGSEGGPEPDINTHWRFSRWSIDYNTYIRWGETDYDGGNHGEPPLPQPGFGYWFYNGFGSAIDFPVFGNEVDLDDSYYIPLNPPLDESHAGLNQLANPFPIVTDWKDAKVEVTTNTGVSEITLSEASSQGLISQWSHRWNGYEYIAYNATNGGDFLIWDGFWVEQLTDSITGTATNTATYDVSEYSNWGVYSTIFSNPSVALPNGETDRFTIEFSAMDYPYMYVQTHVTDLYHGSGWTREFNLNSVGTSMVTRNGFRVTLVEVGSNYLTFEVTNSTNTQPLYGLELYGYVRRSAPLAGSTYTVTRSGGSTATDSPVSLRLIVPPIDVDLSKSIPTNNKNPFCNMMSSPVDWFLPVSVRSSSNADVRDTYNGIGQKAGSYSHYDMYDARNISPYLDSFVDIYFPHNDKADPENYWESHPIKACYDMRPETDTTYWDFVVSSYNFSDQNSTIFWDPTGLPDVLELKLIDQQTLNSIDMKKDSTYTITTPAGGGFKTLHYRIMAVRSDLIFNGVNKEIPQPMKFSLSYNYPNPFNATTSIHYAIDRSGKVNLAIYALDGTLVKTIVDQHQNSGDYKAFWNGTDQTGKPVSSGVYLYRLTTDRNVKTRKMVLLK
ncbi:MAG: T9SS type A sorting domain-containing protein [Candidatus Marinimicrobia bacterium]|nr:T9SS type A sorting domain-containing protein [Candidatus Neomarinimicrobiota bacterium]